MRPLATTLARAECFCLDLAEAAQTAGNFNAAFTRFEAALEIAALDEIERLDDAAGEGLAE